MQGAPTTRWSASRTRSRRWTSTRVSRTTTSSSHWSKLTTLDISGMSDVWSSPCRERDLVSVIFLPFGKFKISLLSFSMPGMGMAKVRHANLRRPFLYLIFFLCCFWNGSWKIAPPILKPQYFYSFCFLSFSGLYIFARVGLFRDCFELQPAFNLLTKRPQELHLCPNEVWKTFISGSKIISPNNSCFL